MKRTVHVVAGLAISAVCLWFTFRGFDLSALRAQIDQFSLVWIFPAMAFYATAFLLRSFRWWWILSPIRRVRFWVVAPALVFGFLMNSVLPARGGEVARAFAVARKGGIHVSSVLGSIMAERTMDIFGLITIMVLASKLLPWSKLPFVPILITLAVLVAIGCVATVVIPRISVGGSVVARKIMTFISELGAGFSAVRRPADVIGLIVVSVVIWLFDAGTALALSRAAGLNLTLSQSAAVNVGVAVGVMIPAAPGYVGTYEFFGKNILTMLGFAASPALTFIIFLHFFQTAMIVVLMGLPSIFWLGLQPDVEMATVP